MKTIQKLLNSLLLLLFLAAPARAVELTRREWKIDGVTREALLYQAAEKPGVFFLNPL